MALETDSSAEGSAAHAVQQPPEANQAIPPARLTNFFIEDILKPEFGKKRDSSSQRDSDGCKVEDADEDSLSSLHDARDGAKLAREPILWPAWVYCTRYSDRPSSGPRSRKLKKKEKKPEEKRPRTAFTNEQLQRLKKEFEENRYLTENRRQDLARELKLNESQIKIWFQNKRAKMKKATGVRNGLALQLMAQGLYNHSTVSLDEGDSIE